MKNNIVTFFIIIIAILVVLSPFAIVLQSQMNKGNAIHEANSLILELKRVVNRQLNHESMIVYPPLKNSISGLIKAYKSKINVKAFSLTHYGEDNKVLYSYIYPDMVNKTPWTEPTDLNIDTFKHATTQGTLEKKGRVFNLYLVFEYQNDMQIRSYLVQGIAFAAAILIMSLFLMIFTPKKRNTIIIEKNTAAHSGSSNESNAKQPVDVSEELKTETQENTFEHEPLESISTTVESGITVSEPESAAPPIINQSEPESVEPVPAAADVPSEIVSEIDDTPSPADDFQIEEEDVLEEYDFSEIEEPEDKGTIVTEEEPEEETVQSDFNDASADELDIEVNEEAFDDDDDEPELSICLDDDFDEDGEASFLTPTLSDTPPQNSFRENSIDNLQIEINESEYSIHAEDELQKRSQPEHIDAIDQTGPEEETPEQATQHQADTQPEPVNQQADTGTADPVGLFSPHSGLCRADYLQKRLTLELERAAYSDQDLCMTFMRFSGMNKNDSSYKTIANEILSRLAFEDLCFETEDEDTYAVILPNNDLDQAITSIEDFSEKGQFADCKAGISSRNGRLVDGSRMIFEAKAALLRSNSATPIVGFKPDPGKYRTYISTGS